MREIRKAPIQLDPWQEEVLNTDGNICLRSGRQVGKSTVVAVKTAKFAIRNANTSVMVISATERQAFLLFSKILSHLLDYYKIYIKTGKDRPTKTEIKLTNGSIIRCLPTGLDGIGIRGYTVNLLIADEAAFIPEDVWSATTPMLATTKGNIILLSTPHGREGYFYKCFDDDSFTKFHVSSEQCPRIDKEFLKREKARMSELEYTQEYLGEFIDELRQFFKDELVKSLMNLQRTPILKDRDYFLGVDIARMGDDETTFEVLRMTDNNKLIHVENQVTKKTKLTETSQHIIELDKLYNFVKIYVDDEGLGIGVYDILTTESQTKRKTIALRNSRKIIDYKEERKKKMLKEDLYFNLLKIMERGDINFLTDPEIFMSFKSVQYEYQINSRGEPFLHIFGNYTHIVEGLIRAAWSLKEKRLNTFIDYI